MSGPKRSAGVCILIAVAAFVISGTVFVCSNKLDLPHTLPIIVTPSGGNRVEVQFVGEALCPDCASFTTKILEPIFTTGLNDLINLKYLGWGNAKNESGNVVCQHGPRECELNKVLNCAQHHSSSQEEFFNFLYCLEKKAFISSEKDVLEVCSADSKLSEKDIRECTAGKLGTDRTS